MRTFTLSLLSILIPVFANAFTGTVEIDGIYYEISTKAKTASVVKPSGFQYTGDIIIPSTVTYEDVECVVNAIGEYAFYINSKVKSIIMPNTIEKFDAYSFWGTRLERINIPSSLKSMDKSALYKIETKDLLIDDLAYWCNSPCASYIMANTTATIFI